MTYSLTTLFVVPAGDTVPTVTETQDLAAGKVGVYRNDWSVGTVANIAGVPYIYIVQGRSEPFLTGSKKSDKIALSKVIEKYKSIGGGTAVDQVTNVTDFKAKCEEEITVTLRLHSYYIDTAFYNGLTRSVTVKAPCCDCGGDPCEALDATAHEAVVDSFVTKINAEPMLSEYVVASKTGTGLDAELVITGLPVKVDTKNLGGSDLNANPYHKDRLIFRTYVYKGPATTADFLDTDACEVAGTVVLTTRSTYGPKNSAAEVRQMQEYYHSYQSIHKDLFSQPGWNQTYEDFIDNTKNYNLLYIKFHEYDGDDSVAVDMAIKETVIIAYPTDNNGTLETILETYLGAFPETGNNINADVPSGDQLTVL
jgi:hypothetical protein